MNINTLKDLILYQSENSNVQVEVLYDNEDFWLTQKTMAELFNVKVNTINYHLKEIFNSGELSEKSVIRKIRITAKDGKDYNTNFYSLDAIIAVGYRVNSKEATAFRIWATNTLKEYIKKGFVLNSEFLKNAPDGKILETDVVVAKNYLFKEEITELNNLVSMYLDFAERQVRLGHIISMQEWKDKLELFLNLNEYNILKDNGKIKREVADKLALDEYEKYRVVQDKKYISDFDELLMETKNVESKE